VGYVLDIIPALHDGLAIEHLYVDMGPSSLGDKIHAQNKDIKEVLELLVSTYILFEPSASGCISRVEVDRIVKEKQKRDNLDSFFTSERWDEMGWDSTGKIDFGEFIFHFSAWVDLFEE
jgi:Ca2+-binding EF-hand superfamily protein